MNKVLVISPHPDDETLGCGGTLIRHKKEGDEIHWLIMTNVNSSEKKIHSVKEKEIEEVSKAYNFDSTSRTKFLTSELDSAPRKEIIQVISKVFEEIQPNYLYLPFKNDIHSDHSIVFDAAASCTKSFRYPYVKKVMIYETISETEFSIRPDREQFKPNLWIDISDYIDEKIEIMSLYESEIGKEPFPRSEQNIRSLAKFRGSTVGALSAEAFILLKEII
tara:strand:- start:1105 stop:1764 length:660 start_codon:yes stop_codon:yes gene_type:complete